MKPFVVEFTLQSVVMAEDAHHAHSVALEQFRDIARDEAPDVWVSSEIACEDDLPDGWDGMCLPYGDDGNTRLSEILGSAK